MKDFGINIPLAEIEQQLARKLTFLLQQHLAIKNLG
jgi:hypothetical protein